MSFVFSAQAFHSGSAEVKYIQHFHDENLSLWHQFIAGRSMELSIRTSYLLNSTFVIYIYVVCINEMCGFLCDPVLVQVPQIGSQNWNSS